MKIEFALPQIGKQAGPEGVAKVAEIAEKLGYDSLRRPSGLFLAFLF